MCYHWWRLWCYCWLERIKKSYNHWTQYLKTTVSYVCLPESIRAWMCLFFPLFCCKQSKQIEVNTAAAIEENGNYIRQSETDKIEPTTEKTKKSASTLDTSPRHTAGLVGGCIACSPAAPLVVMIVVLVGHRRLQLCPLGENSFNLIKQRAHWDFSCSSRKVEPEREACECNKLAGH